MPVPATLLLVQRVERIIVPSYDAAQAQLIAAAARNAKARAGK